MKALRFGPLAGATALLMAIGACAASPDQPRADGGSSTPTAAGFPVRVDNCGFEVVIDEPPTRIVTIKSTSTELVLHLGLGERLVGTAFPDGDLPEGVDLPSELPPVLSDKAPGQEAVLGVEPDLVFGGWESNFTRETAGEREELAELGVATYVAPPACQDPAYQPSPLGFDDIFDYIDQVGMLLGVEQQAKTLVAQQQDRLEAITPDERGLSAVWYSSGSDIPFVGGGIGAPQLLMETAGLTNINADIDDTWASVAWEAIADQNPDVIVLVDSAWNTVDNKIDVLESNPITARMDAVKNERYLTVDFPASEAGVRSVDAAASLASQLAELD